MNRRDALRACRAMALTGSAIAFAPLIQACSRSTPSPAAATHAVAPSPVMPTGTPARVQPTAAEEAAVTKIALIKTADRAEGVRRAVDLLGLNPVRGNRVLLKPNFNSADEAPGSTHLDTLRALIVALNDMGARAITVGDRRGMGGTRAVMERNGVFVPLRLTRDPPPRTIVRSW